MATTTPVAPPVCPPPRLPMFASPKEVTWPKFRVSSGNYTISDAKTELRKACQLAGLIDSDGIPQEKSAENEIANAVIGMQNSHDSAPTEKCNRSIFLCCYQQVHPQIQDGPKCGLVALSMASKLLCKKALDICDILAHCKSMGYTSQGEMFSAQAMCGAAQHLLQCPVHLVEDAEASRDDLIQHLLQGHPVLFPYDADRNHGPGLRGGSAAHWAVLTGVVIHVEDVPVSMMEICEKDEETDCIYHINSTSNTSKLSDFEKLDMKNVYVCSRQGKSNHMRLWRLDDMLASSSQMKEIGKDVLDRLGQKILPLTFSSLENDLANKAVCLICNKMHLHD